MTDWQLAQATVDFRNEERLAANGRAGRTQVTTLQPVSAGVCPACLIELDEDGFCSMCGRVVRP